MQQVYQFNRIFRMSTKTSTQMDKMGNHPKTDYSRLVMGLLLILLAGLLLIDNFDLYPVDWGKYIFTWQTLLIVIGLILFPNRGNRTTGTVLIAIGAFFLAAKFYELPVSVSKLFWPAVILFIGISLLFGSRKRNWHPYKTGEVNDDLIDDVSIFGGSDQKFTSQQFKGGKITNIFGGSTIDLSSARLEPGMNVVDLLCIFGGSKLIIPSEWRVKVEVISIFGGVSDKRKLPQTLPDNAPELVLKGLVLFGGVEIKSF